MSPSRPRLDSALVAWRAALGPEAVVVDEHQLARARRGTFATAHAIPAILRPATPDDVAACLRIAAEHGVPVYPVSTGKNWGYGSRVPTEDGTVLLELGQLDRILDHQEDLGIVTVEPGVTFRMLSDHLRARGSRLSLGQTGGPLDASVLGNALERGLVAGAGPGPSDRFSAVASLDVVLADGTRLRPEREVHRWGLGPYLDGLFTQSSLGVVVAMTLWLAPEPEHTRSMYVAVQADGRLGTMMEALRALMFDEVLKDGALAMNEHNALARFQQYPWDEMGGRTPLSHEALRLINDRRRHLPGTAAWNAWIRIGSVNRAGLEAATEQCRLRLGGVADRLAFVDAGGVSVDTWEASVDRRLLGPSPSTSPRAHEPVPDTHSLRVAYWRKRSPVPVDPDPDRDGCGLLWCTAVLPLRAGDVDAAARLAAQVMTDAGFEPLLSMRAADPRAAHLVAAIVYDREVPGADEQAAGCHDALLAGLRERGWPPYRLGINSMGAMADLPDHRRVGATLKRALDPAGILAPGRYV